MLQIVDSLRARTPQIPVRPAFIELAEPLLPAVLADVPPDRRVVLVPLLLASGYHDRVDLPAAIASARPGTAHAKVLGPDRLLAVALVDRLRSAGWRPGEAVVLAAAGSSDPDAIASVHTQATLLRTELTQPPSRTDASARSAVWVGFGAGAEPTVEQAVGEARAAGAGRVVIAPYLLAPGHFADRLANAGADLVAAPLGAHPAVIELVLRRAAAASTKG